jgi:hypothetical protein
MVFELDDGVNLVWPYGKARGNAGNIDLSRGHFYWRSPNDAVDGADNWRQTHLGT